MVRILLVIDDYNEMIYLQTVLKKIGFDIEGLNSSKKYADSSLGFNPKIVIGTALGKKVDISVFGKDVRKSRGMPKLIALVPTGRELSKDQIESAGIDLTIDSPVNVKKLVLGISSLAGIDEAGFLEKLDKMAAKGEVVSSSDLPTLGSLDNLDGDHTEVLAKKELGQLLDGTDTSSAVTNYAATNSFVEPDSASKATVPKKSGEVSQLSPEEIQVRRSRFEKFLGSMEKPKPGRFIRDRILNFNKKIRSSPKPDDLDEVEDQRKQFVKALFTKKS